MPKARLKEFVSPIFVDSLSSLPEGAVMPKA